INFPQPAMAPFSTPSGCGSRWPAQPRTTFATAPAIPHFRFWRRRATAEAPSPIRISDIVPGSGTIGGSPGGLPDGSPGGLPGGLPDGSPGGLPGGLTAALTGGSPGFPDPNGDADPPPEGEEPPINIGGVDVPPGVDPDSSKGDPEPIPPAAIRAGDPSAISSGLSGSESDSGGTRKAVGG